MGMFNTDIKTMLIEEQRRLADLGYEFDITEMYGIFQCFCSEFGGSLYAEGAEDPWQGFREEWLAIDEKYRKFFMSAFPMHYFNDEIGLETPMMFKIALASKLYENSAFINGVLENLDKNIFGTYSVRKLVNDNERTHVISKDGTVERDIANTGGSSDNENSANNETWEYEKYSTHSNTNRKQGDDVSGWDETHQNNLSQTLEKIGKYSTSKTGHDDVDYGKTDTGTAGYGKETVTELEHGHQIDTDNTHTGNNRDITSGTTTKGIAGKTKDVTQGRTTTTDTVDNNGSVVTADTPQGSLSNIRSGNVQKGAGISAGVGGGMTFNYMSGASLADSTTVNQSVVQHDTTDKPTVSHEYENYLETETPNVTHTITINESDDGSESHSGTDTTTETTGGQDTNTHVLSGTDSTVYGSTETTDFDYEGVDQTGRPITKHYSEKTTNTDRITDDHNFSDQYNDQEYDNGSNTENMNNYLKSNTLTKGLTNTHNDSTSDDSESHDLENGTQNELLQATENNSIISLEMLMKAEPLMNKIWDIFDDIFMQIIDVFP